MSVTMDTSRLEQRLKELQTALLGQGATPGELQRALSAEAGQCAWKIAESLGPTSQKAGAAAIEKNMLGYFRSIPEPAKSNLTEEQTYSSTADFTWLYAAPMALVGINDEDNQVKASVSEAVELYYANRKIGYRGDAWVKLGRRGKQAVMRLNRIRLSNATFNGVKRAIAARIGQSKAAWARTTLELLPGKRIPGWVRAQIGAVISNGKSIYDGSGLNNRETPFVEFGSRAKGVQSQPKIQEQIYAGIKSSEETLKAKIAKVIKGFTYDWNNGAVFRKNDFSEN